MNYLSPGFKPPKYHTLEKVITVVTLLDLKIQFQLNWQQAEDLTKDLSTFSETMDMLHLILSHNDFLPRNLKLLDKFGKTAIAQMGETLNEIFDVRICDPVAKLSFANLVRDIRTLEQKEKLVESKENESFHGVVAPEAKNSTQSIFKQEQQLW